MPANKNKNKRKPEAKTTHSRPPLGMDHRAIAEAADAIERAGRPTPAEYRPTTWGVAQQVAQIPLAVPSGQTCLVRTVGIPGLIQAGILNQLDSLTALVSDKYVSKLDDGSTKIDLGALAEDEDNILTIMEVMDRVVCYCVVEPVVVMPPPNDEDGEPSARIDGVVYADTVPDEDKAFIFQFVTGGTSDLEKFHNTSAELLGGVVTIPAAEHYAEPAVQNSR